MPRRYRTQVNHSEGASSRRIRAEWIDTLEREGWFVTEWQDEPHTRYGTHAHADSEVRVVIKGSMAIVIDGVEHPLRAGDRFDVEPDVVHSAVVGPDGCTYLAGARR